MINVKNDVLVKKGWVDKMMKNQIKKTKAKAWRTFICIMLVFALTSCLIPFYPANAKITTEFDLTSDSIQDVPPNYTPSLIPYNEIGARIEQFMEENENELAGVSLTVFLAQEDMYTGYFGHSDIDNNVAVDENTVYEWGSISKLLTWVSVMQLYEKGLIDFEKDIREYLPEGFFRKLSYDEPITILNLMNHNAGWQEVIYDIETVDENSIISLGDALKRTEPRQVHRPGEVVAYSNWGAALAGYVVENITGMDFADYVKENIFKPLGMEHTALRGDHSDNQWVKENREKTLCYSVTPAGKVNLGSRLNYILLYPAGAATGTLSDLTKFAKMFTAGTDEDCKVFKSVETLNLMKEATLFYKDSDLRRNCHGMWVENFTRDTLGHNGATGGFSTTFMFEPQSGLGIVIMSNEVGESTFNSGLPELLYGNYEKNSRLKNQIIRNPIDPSGALISYRGFSEGPLSLLSALSFTPIGKSKDGITYPVMGDIKLTRLTEHEFLLHGGGINSLFYITKNEDDSLNFQTGGADYYRISILKFYLNFVSAIFPLILMVLLIIAGIVILILISIRRKKKKTKEKADGICGRIYLIQHILGIAFGIFFLITYFLGIIPLAGKTLVPVCILTFLFALAFSALGILNLIRSTILIIKKKNKIWGSLKYYIISFAEFISVFCICYWQMFFFWKA